MRGFYGRLKVGERVMFWWLVFWFPGVNAIAAVPVVVTLNPDWFMPSLTGSLVFGTLGTFMVWIACVDNAFNPPWLERVLARELPSKTSDLEAQIARMDAELRRLGAS